MDYERGLEHLKTLAQQGGWYEELEPLETALSNRLEEEWLYGSAPQTTQDILRRVDQLNRLCRKRLQISFNDLCRGAVPSPTAPSGKLERSLGSALCLYTHDDQSFYHALKTALSLWQQQGKITWLELGAGDTVARTTQAHLQKANLILLLCSASFFADPNCHTAMMTALQEQQRRRVLIVPVLARACAWEESACAHLEVLPENQRPLNAWDQPDQAYEEIRRGLIRLLSRS